MKKMVFKQVLSKVHTIRSVMPKTIVKPNQMITTPLTSNRKNPQPWLSDRTDNILLRSLFYVKRSKICVPERWYNVVPADGFILDLEDAVPYDQKFETRVQIADTLDRLPNSELPHILIRINDLNDNNSQAKWRDDIERTVHRRLLAYVVPKIRHPDQIHEIADYLTKCEKEFGLPMGHHKLAVLIETADGIRRAYEIAEADPRIIAMTVGRIDLMHSLKCALDSSIIKHVCNDVAIAARAANIMPLLSANCDLNNYADFERECVESKNLGCVGRSTLTIKQVQIANRVFAIRSDQAIEAEQILNGEIGLFKTSQGQMIGPPHKKEAASLLRRFDLQNFYEKEKDMRLNIKKNTSINRLIAHRFSQFVGDINAKKRKILSPFKITIGESMGTFWEQNFFPISKLNTSVEFAKSMGYRNILVPFSLLANWAMSLSVMSFSIKAIVHLELVEAIQHFPVYYGDTIVNEVTIIDVDQKKQGYDIVTSRHILLKIQDGQTIFSAIKKTMFPPGVFSQIDAIDQIAPIDCVTPKLLNHLKTVKSPPPTVLRGHPVSKGQFFVHDLVKSFGPSDAINLSYFLKGVNPLHINNQHKHEHLLVSGPCVIAATIANQGFDFGDILDEKWSNFKSINKTLNNDLISTASYVQNVRPIIFKGENEGITLEEITLIVAGIKNINPDVLAKLNFPRELFLESMKPSDFEKICFEQLPELSHKFVSLGTRTIVRYQP